MAEDLQESFDNQRFTKTFYMKLINEILPDDENLQLTGYARNVEGDQKFILDDGTGQIQVRDIPDNAPYIEENKIYQIAGQLNIDGNGMQYFSAVVISDLGHFNLELYQKALQLRKKYQ